MSPHRQASQGGAPTLLRRAQSDQDLSSLDGYALSVPGSTHSATWESCLLNEDAILTEPDYINAGSFYNGHDHVQSLGYLNMPDFQTRTFLADNQEWSITSPQSITFHEAEGALQELDASSAGVSSGAGSYLHDSPSSAQPFATPLSTAQGSGMDPMQRWRQSPPETEAASLSAISDALRQRPIRPIPSPSSDGRPASTASRQSFGSRSSSSIASSRSSRSVSRRSPLPASRRRKTRNDTAQPGEIRKFPCTFCCDTFKRKHDWARHEKSLHLNVDQWACTPHGGSVLSPTTGRAHCAYCSMLDPTEEHLEGHNHSACHGDPQPHFFRRKDHLVQHLRGFHQLQTLPIIEDWKIEPPLVRSRCGICNETLPSWQARADHLADHFRRGATMKDWKGDHCFDPSITAQIRNALPPYLLVSEARSMVPFSATDPRTLDHLSQIFQRNGQQYSTDQQVEGIDSASGPSFDLTPTSYPKWLAFRLGRFAQQTIANGIFPTDQMFQDESRRLVYGSEDAWEQTMADNDEWMMSFRRQHLSN
ncbi:hypothetical protein NUU61_000167 [Penicillium alfredii]|uniref:C2H2-type domain-containing protein n=1 Tax=Penicillium alfredii TaxID=1506179 RepID=A0A9W9G9M4_9EURO|nr:uncharacterized protein NUU61_000167 [Penicillium alfredii]KAJ5114408.1 hypothetical protein NUU61_000167 [Penicillium alfredii]